MKVIVNLFLIVLSISAFGQGTIDDQLKNDPFFGRLYNPKEAFLNSDPPVLSYSYHDMCFLEDGSGFFTDDYDPSASTNNLNDCFQKQAVYLDSLRIKFSDDELLEIAKNAKLPFYRLAAFKLYAETDYDIGTIEKFLEEEVFNSQLAAIFSFSYPFSNHNEYKENGVPKGYQENPTYANSFYPSWKSIVEYMLQKVSPNDTSNINKSIKKIGLEKYIFLRSIKRYVDIFCISDRDDRSFRLEDYKKDFGEIYLADFNKPKFELKSQFQMSNLTNDTIWVTAKASMHTECEKIEYVIPPKKQVTVEFKSLIDLKYINQGSTEIERNITFQNQKTGETQLYKIKAHFIK